MSTSITYDLYCVLEAQGIDPDSINESAIIDPAFNEEDVFF